MRRKGDRARQTNTARRGANIHSQFIIGRFVLGFGIAFVQMAAPSYTMEVALPQWRGRCTGLYNVGWYFGAIPAAAITCMSWEEWEEGKDGRKQR